MWIQSVVQFPRAQKAQERLWTVQVPLEPQSDEPWDRQGCPAFWASTALHDWISSFPPYLNPLQSKNYYFAGKTLWKASLPTSLLHLLRSPVPTLNCGFFPKAWSSLSPLGINYADPPCQEWLFSRLPQLLHLSFELRIGVASSRKPLSIHPSILH